MAVGSFSRFGEEASNVLDFFYAQGLTFKGAFWGLGFIAPRVTLSSPSIWPIQRPNISGFGGTIIPTILQEIARAAESAAAAKVENKSETSDTAESAPASADGDNVENKEESQSIEPPKSSGYPECIIDMEAIPSEETLFSRIERRWGERWRAAFTAIHSYKKESASINCEVAYDTKKTCIEGVLATDQSVIGMNVFKAFAFERGDISVGADAMWSMQSQGGIVSLGVRHRRAYEIKDHTIFLYTTGKISLNGLLTASSTATLSDSLTVATRYVHSVADGQNEYSVGADYRHWSGARLQTRVHSQNGLAAALSYAVLPGVTATVSGAFDSLDVKNSRWGLGIDVQV